MITATVLAGVAWKSALIAGLTLLLLRFARTRSAASAPGAGPVAADFASAAA